MTVIADHDTDIVTDLDIDFESTPICEVDICPADNSKPAVAILINSACGCRVLMCEDCTGLQQRSNRLLTVSTTWICKFCGREAYGRLADLCRIIPI